MKSTARSSLTGYLFVLPWIVALCVFIGFPFLSGFYFSFCDFPPMRSPLFIGMANYSQLTSDPVFRHSLGVTMTYAAVAIPLGVALALTLAILLNARIRGQAIYRIIFYLPHLTPAVAVAILWMWIFNPQFGLLNIVLHFLMKAADAWTGCFFDLARARQGRYFLVLPSLAMLAGLVLALLCSKSWFGDESGRQSRNSPRSHGERGEERSYDKAWARQAWPPPFLRLIALFCLAVCVLTTLYACFNWLTPVDIKKIHSPGWLSDGTPFPSQIPMAPSWALWSLIVMSMWGVGQMAVIYLAKLQDVPIQLYEAADIDGATWWHKTRHITLPMISPVILFNVVMAIIGAFQIFAEPYIMTGGGPEDKTRFLAMFIYDQAFLYQNVGYASAVAWFLFLLIVGLTLLAFRISRKHVYYAGR